MILYSLSLFLLTKPILVESAEVCRSALEKDSVNYTSEENFQADNGKYEYEGGCKNGLFHGKGILKYPDGGGLYDGQFTEGMRSGNGTMIYSADDKEGKFMYVGEWKDDKESGFGKLEYQKKNPANQTSTEGEFRNGIANGNVTVIWQNGHSYVGNAVNDVKNGFGVYNFSNGNKYTGYWLDDEFNGNGTFTWGEGGSYEGEYKDGFQHGFGKIVYSDGGVYTGEWFEGVRSGNGTFTWPSGSTYQGEFENDFKHGYGVLKFASGNVYMGDFVKGDYNGNGTFIYAEGGSYEGEYKDDLQHGYGKNIYSDGVIYMGEWVEGNRQGNGTIIYRDGKKYTGEWFDDEQNGNGTYTWSNGESYQGEFKNGYRHGHGTYIFSSGNTYIGSLFKGNFNGNGSYLWSSGAIYKGEFKDDLRHGSGRQVYSDGGIYIGEWVDGNRQGAGTLTYKDGTSFKGEWDRDERRNGQVYNKYGKHIYNYWVQKDDPKVELFDSFWEVPDSDFDDETTCKRLDKKILESNVRTPWYIKSEDDRDMQVWEAWGLNYTGKGVVVAVVDDGLARCHSALAKNYDQKASFDFTGFDSDPSPEGFSDYQGTRGGGIIAARREEPVCTIGIAHGAHLGGIRMLQETITDTKEAHSLGFRRDYIDLYQISWGPDDDGKTFDGPGLLTRQTMKDGIKKGREGLGSIYVIAAGIGGTKDDDCNADGYVSSIFTIAVSSVTASNARPGYSERCSAILAATYSGEKRLGTGIQTTGAYSECDLHDGTSASASIASGIIALVLEANPSLTWRDIQHIIVQTSRSENLLKSDTWVTNGAGFRASRSFGFGLMDAKKMVEIAANWTNVPIQTSCKLVTSNPPQIVGMLSTGTTVLKVSCLRLHKLEHVQLHANITSKGVRGLFSLSLTSPAGTQVEMIGKRIRDGTATGFQTMHWPLMTTHFWGESSNGDWTVTLNNDNLEEAEIYDYSIILDGIGKIN